MTLAREAHLLNYPNADYKPYFRSNPLKPEKHDTGPVFTVTVNERQARVIEQALDLHTRLGLGQVREVIDYLPTLRCPERDGDKPIKADREVLIDLCSDITHALGFHGFGHSYGVGHPNVPAAAMIAYDLGAVMRNAIHSLRTDADKHYSVWGNKPLHYGSEPLAVVEVKKEQKND